MKHDPVIQQATKAIDALKEHVDVADAEVKRLIGDLARLTAINSTEAREFLREPWCILPKSREEWWVTIPKWVGLQAGWLERATDTYNVFVVNRYSHWLGGIPKELKDKLELPDPVKATVSDGRLQASDDVAAKMKWHIGSRNKDGFKITRGHEFQLMAELIDLGSLPFAPKPVDLKDIVMRPIKGPPDNLRDYQQEAWEKFMQYGAVGIYWPWGMGKTVIGCHILGRVRGPALVVCPTRTLVDQWRERLNEWLPIAVSARTEIVTYHSWGRVKDLDWGVTIFDEAHRLPANTFSRLASIRTKYRVGLSASPYREDGRTSYIFALTGYPVGVDWTEFLRSGLIQKPDVEVRIVSGWREKRRVTEQELRDVKGQAIVFCDSIDNGRQLANSLGIPHIYGQTKDRLSILRKAKAAVVSRVGDEGLSLPDLKKVIEVDFHGSSRRQESQRVGRLLHAKGKGEHVVLMTADERDRFEDRFLALEEKGIKVNVRE